MPQSRHRHKHQRHHPAQTPAVKAKTARKNPVTIMVVFGGILGTIAALLAAGSNPVWLLTGVFVGALIGYFIGKRMSAQ